MCGGWMLFIMLLNSVIIIQLSPGFSDLKCFSYWGEKGKLIQYHIIVKEYCNGSMINDNDYGIQFSNDTLDIFQYLILI